MQKKNKINVIGFYKITKMAGLKKNQYLIKKKLFEKEVKGTVIISPEGINGTLAGKKDLLIESISYIKKKFKLEKFDSRNHSQIEYQPFFRPKIKIKNEVVPIGMKLTCRQKKRNKYIEPKHWNNLISNKDVMVLDIRKTMEFRLGTFKNAIDPKVNNFRQFPTFFRKLSKNKKIAMFCTGGIRCEKAANFLRKKGFNEIYQLKGGILNYLKLIKKVNSLWKGECFVFDNRVSLKHKLLPGKYKICSACRTPVSPKERKSKKYVEDISCPYCYKKLTKEKKIKLLMRKSQKKVKELI